MPNYVLTTPSAAFLAMEARLRQLKSQPPAVLAQRRLAMQAMADQQTIEYDVTFTELQLAGIPCLRVAQGHNQGVVFFVHGGAYQLGSARTYRGLAARVAVRTGCEVISIDYRLAPEHPFPAAFDDVVQAYVGWHSERQAGDQYDAPVALFGDSAGGGLALAAALEIKRRGLTLPRCITLLSPWIDLSCNLASYERLAGRDVMMTREALTQAAAMYLAGASARNPKASPLHSDPNDWLGLPPVLIQVGECEVLLDESLALEVALATADVDVQLEVWQHMGHAWQHFAPTVPEANQAIDALCQFISTQQDVPARPHAR